MRLGGAVELALAIAEAATHRQHPPGVRVQCHDGTLDLGALAQQPAPRVGFADLRHDHGIADGERLTAGPAQIVGAEPDAAAVVQPDLDPPTLARQDHASPPVTELEARVEPPECCQPVVAGGGEVELAPRPAPALPPVIVDQPIAQGAVGGGLQDGRERDPNRQPALVEALLAEPADELPAHLFDEEVGLGSLDRRARMQGDRLGAGGVRLGGGDVAVRQHAAEDVVAALQGRLRVVDRIVARRRLGQASQHGRLGDGQLVQ